MEANLAGKIFKKYKKYSRHSYELSRPKTMKACSTTLHDLTVFAMSRWYNRMPSGRDVSDVSEFNMHKRSSEKYPRDRRLGTGLEPAERLPVAVSSCIPYMSCYILATSAQLLNNSSVTSSWKFSWKTPGYMCKREFHGITGNVALKKCLFLDLTAHLSPLSITRHWTASPTHKEESFTISRNKSELPGEHISTSCPTCSSGRPFYRIFLSAKTIKVISMTVVLET
ncbi:unnamed protein product [Nesidiocoris tenuis]|uniref:Uncharacterized protein n=1 Tax=Nesidiocoris tenuis TaxID=355587 RepID=A0A6H5H5F8_9HEMI|nr:unnamed protein product [Nesidiocoris tenuis]